jgi:hypothetical protein
MSKLWRERTSSLVSPPRFPLTASDNLFAKDIAKQKITESEAKEAKSRIVFVNDLSSFSDVDFAIEVRVLPFKNNCGNVYGFNSLPLVAVRLFCGQVLINFS